MDSQTFKIVEDVVNENVQNCKMFTAFDITREVRARVGKGTPVPHGDVKQEVHNMFASGQFANYARTLANLPISNPQPWIYHQNSDDPLNYGMNVPAQQLPQITQAPNGNDDGVNQTGDGTYKVDARGTLCLPAQMVRDLGAGVGDSVYVYSDPLSNAMLVSLNDNLTGFALLSDYTVDNYHNVRVTQHALQSAAQGGSEYEVNGVSDKILIKRKR